jgi:hypothetical protein
VNIALKVVDWGSGGLPILVLIEQIGASWSIVGEPIYEMGDDNTGVGGYAFEVEAAKMGGMVNWIRSVLVPAVNARLAARFKPTAAPAPAPSGDPVERFDAALIAALRWAPQADGTLKVVA